MNDKSSLTNEYLALIQTPSLPALGPESRAEAQAATDLLPAIDRFCTEHDITGLNRELLRSAALLWHDDLDRSHSISQDIKTADGSFLHGIMHRREPDSSNAKYWFRLVGEHSAYPAIVTRLQNTEHLTGRNELLEPLLSGEDWDPFAFVDACSRAMQGNQQADTYRGLQEIQRIEFESLIDDIIAG